MNMHTIKTPPKLKPTLLYSGDNGRIFCGSLACAGQSAHFTGRTTAGARVQKITEQDNAAWMIEFLEPIRCETCKRQFPVLTPCGVPEHLPTVIVVIGQHVILRTKDLRVAADRWMDTIGATVRRVSGAGTPEDPSRWEDVSVDELVGVLES